MPRAGDDDGAAALDEAVEKQVARPQPEQIAGSGSAGQRAWCPLCNLPTAEHEPTHLIEGLDRQACGGTHLSNTAESPPIRITKVENKGRHNRRVRFVFAE